MPILNNRHKGIAYRRLKIMVMCCEPVQYGAGEPNPLKMTQHRLHRRCCSAPAAAAAAGFIALAAAPQLAPAAWVVLLGLGLGAGFALGLVLLVDHAPDPAESARLAAMAFLVSYTPAAGAPAITGALRDATGGFPATFTALTVLALAQLALATRLAPARPL